jgi:hypothetical protein
MKPLELARRTTPPDFRLRADSGVELTLSSYRARQRSLLLIFLHDSFCAHCREVVEGLVRNREEIESWDFEILLARSGSGRFPVEIPQSADSMQSVKGDYAPGSDVVLACIDFRGRLMDGWSLNHPEGVDWREVTETVRWVAIQEPECGTCVIAEGWDE